VQIHCVPNRYAENRYVSACCVKSQRVARRFAAHPAELRATVLHPVPTIQSEPLHRHSAAP
jgi:hypothetical protein